MYCRITSFENYMQDFVFCVSQIMVAPLPFFFTK